jgi:hypothetical protein
LNTCVKLATDSDAKAQEFAGTGDGRKLLHTDKLFRFDIEQGTEGIELYEFDRPEDQSRGESLLESPRESKRYPSLCKKVIFH